jgi:catalase
MRHSNPADPVCAPNSDGGPQADPNAELPGWLMEAGEIGRCVYTAHRDGNDFWAPPFVIAPPIERGRERPCAR